MIKKTKLILFIIILIYIIFVLFSANKLYYADEVTGITAAEEIATE